MVDDLSSSTLRNRRTFGHICTPSCDRAPRLLWLRVPCFSSRYLTCVMAFPMTIVTTKRTGPLRSDKRATRGAVVTTIPATYAGGSR